MRGATKLQWFLLALGIATSKNLLGRLDSSNVPTPSLTTDACKLHYSHFHLLFTIPPLAVLYFLATPFLTVLDWHKLYLLPVIAFVWTTPWDNELVRQEAWWYPTSCVLARVGYVPVEEYAFFILQSLMTTLLTILLTRWNIPRTSSNHALARFLPLLPASAIAAGLYTLFKHEEGHVSRYYLSMIAWWASMPLMLLWWGTSQSWASLIRGGQFKVWALSVVLPTLYLCSADVYALRRGTWHISERRSLQIFLAPDLPIEEAFFFLMTNLILVSACFAFDRVVWQKRTEDTSNDSGSIFALISPTYFHLDWTTAKHIWHIFARLDAQGSDASESRAMEGQREHAMGILARASKSFSVAATLLPWDLRIDMGCLYAFARAMDDFIDQPAQQPLSQTTSSPRIDLLLLFVRIAFDEEAISRKVIQGRLQEALIRYSESGNTIQGEEGEDLLVSALAVSSLRRIIPERLWRELIDGYREDSAAGGPHFKTFEAQANYAQNVAGSIGEMCVRVVFARQGTLVSKEYAVPRDITRHDLLASQVQAGAATLKESQVTLASPHASVDLELVEKVLRDARKMGVSLQLVNIARDIVKDSSELKRCYLVTGSQDLANIRSTLCNGVTIESFSSVSEDRSAVVRKKSKGENKEGAELQPHNKLTADDIFAQKIYLLDVADVIYRSSISSINLLPCKPASTGLRVACAVYADIGRKIRLDGPENCLQRSHSSNYQRLWVALKAVYWSDL
ncbi:hypothetical protein CBS101457_004647 [Exobasidium rhododendri]|nr:hypothetical protein CBS101457_004647 [Exobasidium rhododendri]